MTLSLLAVSMLLPAAPLHGALALLSPGGGNPMVATLVMYGAIFAIFWFVIFRPQQKQRRAHEETIRQLKKGDEVVTAGGIIGEVVTIRPVKADAPSAEDRITIKSGESRLVVERGRIVRLTSAPATSGASSL
jgi:preprotein translocase subunit YajC